LYFIFYPETIWKSAHTMQSRVTGQNQNMERFIYSSLSSNDFAALALYGI